MKKFFLMVLAVLLGAGMLMGAGAKDEGAKSYVLRNVSLAEGTTLYEHMIAMAKVISDNNPRLKIATTTAQSAAHSIRMVESGEAEIVNADLWNLVHCYKDKGAWEKQPQKLKPWGGIATMTTEFFILTLAQRSDINSLSDIAGKTWNHSPAAAGPG